MDSFGFKDLPKRWGGMVVAAIFCGKTVCVLPMLPVEAAVWGKHITTRIERMSKQ